MKIICGLGNPGSEYAEHRHNLGFMVVDALATAWGVSFTQTKFDGLFCVSRREPESVLLLKPQTFMNRSGDCLAPTARFQKVPPEHVLVVHDELDLPLGTVQLKRGGGSGGHNGLKSIASALGGADFARLRMGIGRPAVSPGRPPESAVVAHVLAPFSREEAGSVGPMIDAGVTRCEAWATLGLDRAMNQFNRRQ